MDNEQIIKAVRRWVEVVVVKLNLCPFARPVLAKNQIRFTVSRTASEAQLLKDLQFELLLLEKEAEIETTLLIHPNVLQDFFDYNDFLDDAENLLIDMDLEGVYQIASFHPDYQFDGTQPADAENYTNRSPYPMVHLLREESISRALLNYPDPENIPERNIELLKDLGRDEMQKLLLSCLAISEE